MYCIRCGNEIDGNLPFCPYCGTRVPEEAQQSSTPSDSPTPTQTRTAVPKPAPVIYETPAEEEPPKVWGVFARIGKILGIVCLSTALIPFLNFFSLALGIPGIVFSCLGRRANTQEAYKNCSLGLPLSITAVAVSFAMIIVYYSVLFTALM